MSNESSPPVAAYLSVIAADGEVGLMGALEDVVRRYSGDSAWPTGLSPDAVARAVNWLNAKYG